MKKVIFLDLDGVLNSRKYDAERDWSKLSYIDETRLPILKRIVDETGGYVVFSSSWKEHWQDSPALCDQDGKYIVECLGRYGLKIVDKTPVVKGGDKSDEIALYLQQRDDIVNYVILDDDNFDWSVEMRSHVVKTSAYVGRGLENHHAQQAIDILNQAE